MRNLVSLLVVGLCTAGSAASQVLDCTQPTPGPDLVAGELTSVAYFGAVGPVAGYAWGTVKCNYGDAGVASVTSTSAHPVLVQNLYRLLDGRFEQIGMSWARHGYVVAAQQACCATCQPEGPSSLGPGCSDENAASTNGAQELLGPRSEIDPVTATFPYPFTGAGQTGDAIFRRLQVHRDDLDPALNPGARYFAEAHFLAADDAAAGNAANNASWREVVVGPFAGGVYTLTFSGPTRRGASALEAWAEVDPEVRIGSVQDIDGGRFLLASRVTSLGAGQWHYEYALYNMSSHLAGKGFVVPLPAAATVTGVGFSDVHYHSGEPFNGTDWTVQVTASAVRWDTDFESDDANANALRFGTVYGFRFDADAAPTSSLARIDYFRRLSAQTFTFVAGKVPDTGQLGASYCTPPPANSAGPGAFLSATGSDVAAQNAFTLTMNGVPPGQFGYFITSMVPGIPSLPGAGPGPLCMLGPIGRFVSHVQNSGPQGVIQAQIDLTAMPLTPPVPVQAGETWYFQGWYRDVPHSQFSDALAVHFR